MVGALLALATKSLFDNNLRHRPIRPANLWVRLRFGRQISPILCPKWHTMALIWTATGSA